MGEMQGLTVPKGAFPSRRKASCCGKQTQAGEVVVLVQVRQGGNLQKHVILHKRCVAALIQDLPEDAQDYASRFDTIRKSVIETGEPFPSRGKRKVK